MYVPLHKRDQRGITLVEMIVYIAVLASVTLATFSFLLWTIRSSSKTNAMHETLDNAKRAMEVMVSEIRESRNIYIPTSVFSTNPGQLSLTTLKYLPADETATYVDFYLCGTQLCFKKEGQNPAALTSDVIEVNQLVFIPITTSGIVSSIQIILQLDFKNPRGRPEYDAQVNLTSTASLRLY